MIGMQLQKTMYSAHRTRGVTIILVIVFSGAVLLMVSALMSFIVRQSQLSVGKSAREQAFAAAEAGLEYYHWFLSVYPEDLTNGTGGVGPYVHNYDDPQNGTIGSFSLDIVGNMACDVLQSIDITAIGTASADERYSRTLVARHAKPSVAEYASILHEGVWLGEGEDIVGPYHSNNGIRLDSENNSLVTSAVSSWTCDSSYGCSPSQTVDGIFGSGSGSALWRYPEDEIDFDTIVQDVGDLKSYAQSGGGLYFGTASTDSTGYHFVFQSNGTVDVYQVNNADGDWAWNDAYGYDYDSSYGWRYEYYNITSETYLGNYAIPPACSLIFSEGKAWVEGTTDRKVTLVAATDGGSYDPDIMILDDLDYATLDGSAGFTFIAENNVLISRNSPQNMTMRGVFVAQNGHFGRDYFSGNVKGTLTLQGTIVSRKRETTSWYCGYVCSGYATRINSYDRHLTTDPPPFTPVYSQDPLYITWRED